MAFVPPTESNDRPASEPTLRVRASDTDRAAVAAVLQEAISRGLLSHDEGAERMTTAYSATFVDELPPLSADLPPSAESAGSRTTGRHGPASVLMTRLRREVSMTAAAGPRSRRVLAAALLMVVLLAGLLILGGFELLDGVLE